MSDEEELFADLGDLSPLPPHKHPGLDRLPYIGYDIIHRLCGFDMHDEQVPMARKMAANEWFWRRTAGQRYTFEQVFRGGSLANTDMGANPTTAAGAISPAANSDTDSPSASATPST